MKMPTNPSNWPDLLELLQTGGAEIRRWGPYCSQLLWRVFESLIAVAAGKRCFLRGFCVGR